MSHICEQLQDYSKQTASFKVTIHRDNGGWYLHYLALADKHMVASEEADFVGEEVNNVSLKIEYCPFCGSNLDACNTDSKVK